MSQSSSGDTQGENSMVERGLGLVTTWDSAWGAAYQRVIDHPWSEGVLPRRTCALILVALNTSCTARSAEGTRDAIRAALAAGATRDEVLAVLKMAALLAIHACSLGAPLLLAEIPGGATEGDGNATAGSTPACDAMRAIGQWNPAWDPFFSLDPAWTDQFMAAGLGLYQDGVLPEKDVELVSIALDASVTHMYAPGVSRHIKGALAAGATPAEIMAVLELCVAFGATSLQMGVPILAEELARIGAE